MSGRRATSSAAATGSGSAPGAPVATPGVVPSEQAGRSPLRAILAAISAGAATVVEIQRRTGLSADVASAAVEHLVRLGRVEWSATGFGCPASGCGGCAVECAPRDSSRSSSRPGTNSRAEPSTVARLVAGAGGHQALAVAPRR